MPIILAIQEAEIKRMAIGSQPWGNSSKNPSQKRVGEEAQGEGPEFKPQYHKKKKKLHSNISFHKFILQLRGY
jgi:hypothetical protein